MCEGYRLACLKKERTFDTGALLHVLLSVLEHLGLVITLVDGFVREGVAACMVHTVAIVKFPHHFLRFVLSETPQIRWRNGA